MANEEAKPIFNVTGITNINEFSRIVAEVGKRCGMVFNPDLMPCLHWVPVQQPRRANLVQYELLEKGYEEKYNMTPEEAGNLAYNDSLDGTIEAEIAKTIVNLLVMAGIMQIDINKFMELQFNSALHGFRREGKI